MPRNQIFANAIRRFYNYLQPKRAYKFALKDLLASNDLQASSDVLKTMRLTQLLRPIEIERPLANKLLLIAPHPDDEVIGPGGTLMKHLDAGGQASIFYLTLGRKSEQTIRWKEAQAVGGLLGASVAHYDAIADEITIDERLLEIFAETINNAQPDVLLLPCMFDDHDDHRRVSDILLRVWQKGTLNCKPEIWAYQVYGMLPANVVVDISDVIQRKADAIRVHKSQMRNRDWAHFALGLNAFNCRQLSNKQGQVYAESFFVLPVDEYMKLCEIYFSHPQFSYLKVNYQQNSSASKG